MGNENSMIPSPKPSPKAEGQAVSSNSTAFPYVRGSREARLRSHKVIYACYIISLNLGFGRLISTAASLSVLFFFF